MKAHYGIDGSTGNWYAMSEIPRVTQWGKTAEEAQRKLCEYLTKHYGLTVVDWANFGQPDPEDEQEGTK